MDFQVLPGVCSMEPCNLVSSLEYLVSNGRQVLLRGIRLGGSAIGGIRAINEEIKPQNPFVN